MNPVFPVQEVNFELDWEDVKKKGRGWGRAINQGRRLFQTIPLRGGREFNQGRGPLLEVEG